MPSSLDVWQYITQWRSEFMVGGVELKSKLKYSFLVDTKCGQYQSQKTMHISCNRMEAFIGKKLRHCSCKSRMYQGKYSFLYIALGIFLIQLNADSFYPFACWSLCLLILMLILIESRSMLIVYWLCDRKLINAYLTKTAYKIFPSRKSFENLNWGFVKYTPMCLHIYVYINIIVNKYVKKRKSTYRLAN